MSYTPQTILELRRLPRVQGMMRPPKIVMTPERLGAMRQSRLSFIRPLIERATREQWQFQRLRLDVDEYGKGVGLYRIETAGGWRYHAAFFSESRYPHHGDRSFEVDWDILVWLVEGDVDAKRLAYAAREAAMLVRGRGRADPSVLAWTRANRSARMVEHSVSQLALGRQPDLERVDEVGYLVRNVYYQANGMNGTRMFAAFAPDGPLSGVYQVQMLGLYMIREFSFDLIDAMARRRSPRASELDPAIKRYLGVGNATGIGLNYLVTNHPKLMHRWIEQRELSLALVKLEDAGQASQLRELIARYGIYLNEENTGKQASLVPKSQALAEINKLALLVAEICDRGTFNGVKVDHPWQLLCDFAARELHLETQEILHSLLLEVHPSLCAAADAFSAASESTDVRYDMSLSRLREMLHTSYDWAFESDADSPEASYWNWYRSQDGDEPRMTPLSEKHVQSHFNIAVDLPGLVQTLDKRLTEHQSLHSVAEFLIYYPQLRDFVESVQSMCDLDYAFARMNMKHRDFSPLPLTRFVLQALKGMEKTTLMSDRWVRGTFLQGAPIAADIASGNASSDWVYPACPSAH